MPTFNVLFSPDEKFTPSFYTGEDLDASFDEDAAFEVEMQNLNIVHTGGGSDAIATTSTLGSIIVGENLKITPEGVLSVDMAGDISEDNTRPISSAKVYTEIGNINALLETI